VSFDKLYEQHVGKAPLIINDQPAFSEADKEKLNRLIYTTFSRDLLQNIPSCECGDITGEYNIDANGVGVYCPKCETRVKPLFDHDLQPMTWIRAPHGVAGLMNPIVWTMLSEQFTHAGFNLIQWLCDTTYHPSNEPPAVMQAIRDLTINGRPVERSYNYFVQNFDAIIEQLYEIRLFKAKRGKKPVLKQVLERHRDCIFSRYLPIPHRSLLVVEKNDLGTYVDPITTGAVDAIRTLAGVDTEYRIYSTRTKENRTAKTIAQLAAFYETIYDKHLAKKEGIFRKHVFATRGHFTFRAVISSITDAHNYDEIYIPWGVATSVFRIHLMNKLIKLGYTPNEAILFINEHAQKYSPILDGLFKELIAEAPNGRGVSALLNRPPSLARGSIQHVYITKVKSDPSIPTVSLSILIVRSLNADFDGDALQFSLSIDNKMEEEFKHLAPHMSTFGLGKPRTVSDSLAIPKPVVGSISNWLESNSGHVDPVRRERMMSILGGVE